MAKASVKTEKVVTLVVNEKEAAVLTFLLGRTAGKGEVADTAAHLYAIVVDAGGLDTWVSNRNYESVIANLSDCEFEG